MNKEEYREGERQERDWWSEQQRGRERERDGGPKRPSATIGRLQEDLCMMLSALVCVSVGG